MAKDITKVEIAGPCTLTFGGIDVGHTIDGVELTAERDFKRVITDQYGDSPIDYVLTGNRLKIKFKMAQTEWDQWNIAIPETSSYDGASTKDRADFGADAGYSMRGDGKQLVIHPLKNVATDLSDDVTIYKAVSTENVTLPMKIDEQRVLEITLEALVVEDYGTGRRLGHYGPADVS